MHTDTTEAIEEASRWSVGLGMLILALAPLSLPFLILTVAALLPLAVPLIALGLVAAPIVLVRRLLGARRDRRAPIAVPGRRGAAEPGRPSWTG
jgi:hypothetical protein